MEEQNNNAVKLGAINALNKDKVIIISIIVGILLVAAGIFGYIFYQSNVAPVVTFNGGKVTRSDFSIYYKTFTPMLQGYYDSKEIPSLIAEKAGMDKILLMKAKEAGITQSEEDKKQVDDIFADKKNVDTFKERGIDPDKMKELYYSDNIINTYIEKLKKDLSNEDVLNYIKSTNGADADLKEYATRHILFKTIDTTTQASVSEEEKTKIKAEAEAVLVRVNAGEDFATLAKEFSDDSSSVNGGEYKLYMDDRTVKEYVEAVKKLSKGQVYSTLVETTYGYHIIKLEDIVENGRANSDTEREALVNKNFETLSKDLNLKIDKDKLKKAVREITGQDVEIY